MPHKVPEPPWWHTHGYLAGRQLCPPDALNVELWLCVAPMLYTYRVMVCDPGSVYAFVCYPRTLGLDHALRAWQAWDGCSDPPPGYSRWHH